jgi:hypothetical protein
MFTAEEQAKEETNVKQVASTADGGSIGSLSMDYRALCPRR